MLNAIIYYTRDKLLVGKHLLYETPFGPHSRRDTPADRVLVINQPHTIVAVDKRFT